MNIPFTTALIAGSSRGIGRGIAVKLATEGVRRIAVHYCTRRDEAEKTAALLEDAGAEAVVVQADVSNACRAEEMVNEAARQLGGCDIFVHSVIPPLNDIYEHTLATEVPLVKWQLAFDTQARAFFVGARQAAKRMTHGGRILAMSYTPGGQTGGWQPWVGMGSAKAAMESLVRYFAVAVAKRGITVNALSPGWTEDSVLNTLPEQAQDLIRNWHASGWTPMGRLGTPEDIGNVVALFCSDKARWITGQVIYVDGGASLMNPEVPPEIQIG